MDRRTPPPTAEGWYALYDFRRVDWDAWREADAETRERAIEEGRAYLADAASLADAEAGDSASFAVLGHKADLAFLHLRPTLGDLDALERRFERTALAGLTERASSYVSVTEVSGYTLDREELGDLEDDTALLERVESQGTRKYMERRLHPQIPDRDALCFYPMDKRREGEDNWYDLSFEERAEHLSAHGEIGRDYAGEVTQIITGSIGFDDWEWGVALFADDPTAFKRLLYEMRFDPSSSRFAEFGPFYVGRRLAPGDLGAYLAGERVPADEPAGETGHSTGGHPHGESGGAGSADGEHPHGGAEAGAGGDDAADEGDIREALAEMDVYAGQPHGEEVVALALYSSADPEPLLSEVSGLRESFDHYDTHVGTSVYDAGEDGPTAVVSLWETERAADTAAGFLADLPGVEGRADDVADGWGTMGMFYTVKPEYLGDFHETFEAVGGLLAEMDGHRETHLLSNLEDENDLFIASEWDAREDAMAFFRSDAFAETVSWGRDVLDGRPRHVFLA